MIAPTAPYTKIIQPDATSASSVPVKHGDGTRQWFVQPEIRWLLGELKRMAAERDSVKELEAQVPTETNINA